MTVPEFTCLCPPHGPAGLRDDRSGTCPTAPGRAEVAQAVSVSYLHKEGAFHEDVTKPISTTSRPSPGHAGSR